MTLENSNELIIKIRDLKMNFGTKEVLKGINLDIHKGEIIGYIGTNGAGKSTTVKIMLGIISGYTGAVEILGENILKSDGSYKRKIGDVYNSRISSFSKGMRQKVLLISSLIHNPDILFLDEPLNGLDANSVMVIKEILSELARNGKTIFYSSHIIDVVEKISHRIILLNNGVVAADGSFEELKKNSNEESLEEIFNDLTGFNDHKRLAEEFTALIKECSL